MKRMVSIVLMLILLAGCQSPPRRARPKGATLMQRTELFFGLSRPDGGTIGEPVWQAFVDDTITPRFPDGFTLLEGAGQWRQSDGKILHERSKILLLLHPCDADATRKLEEIRTAYKQRFNQESVIREDGRVWVSF